MVQQLEWPFSPSSIVEVLISSQQQIFGLTVDLVLVFLLSLQRFRIDGVNRMQLLRPGSCWRASEPRAHEAHKAEWSELLLTGICHPLSVSLSTPPPFNCC